MRNKFKIMLPDGTEYKPPKGSMVVMNQDGVVFVVTDQHWLGTHLCLLSELVPKYNIVFTKGK